MAPLVSIIIATYNRAHLLRQAIDSVLGQTISDYELIIADDGSIDNTASVVESYRRNPVLASRIHYFRQDNQGKSVALNNALARANGEWIAILDSDDYWLGDKLERQFAALESYKDTCRACFTDGKFVNNPHMDTTLFRFYGQQFPEPVGVLPNAAEQFAEFPAGVSIVTLLARADDIRKAGGFDPALQFTEDYDFLFRLSLVTGFCYVNAPLAIIDKTPAQQRHAGASEIWDNIEFRLQSEQYRYEKWLGLGTVTASMRKSILAHLRSVHSAWANFYLARKEYAQARRSLSAAAKYQLTSTVALKWLLTSLSPQFASLIVRRRGFDTKVF
jgi:glycosyltransferase involved in cell wall biosynthesis